VVLYLEESNRMESVDFGVMKKKKGVTATPNSALAKTNVTNHSSNMGKKRVQGANGVGQGNKGWQSQHNNAGGGYGKQINPIINSLSKAPTYETPKITESLLTQGGFNQALGVVGARNNAKLKSQNQRVLQGVLGSLVSGDSQNRATKNRFNIAGMQDKTDRRGQDFTATANANALDATKSRDYNQNEYYEGMNSVAKERNSIARSGLEHRYGEKVDPNEQRNYRLKIINDGNLQQMYGENVWASMDSDQKSRAKGEYLNSGRIKDYEADNWLTRKLPFTDAEFRGNIDEKDGVATPYRDGTQQQGQGGGEQPKFSLDANQTSALATAVAKGYGVAVTDINTDTNGDFVLPNGDIIPMETAWGRMNGKH